MYYFLYLFVLITFSSHSQTNNPAQEPHLICTQDYVQCLDLLPHAYDQLSSYYSAWYRLKEYEFGALYYLERYDELLVATTEVIAHENVPMEFQLPLTIYHAKALFAHDTNSRQGFEFVNRAKVLYQQRDSLFVAPRRMVMYANLLLAEADKIKQHGSQDAYLAKLRESYEILQQTRKNYLHLNDSDFQIELYANLFNVMTELGKQTKAIDYQKKAVFWVKQQSNKQKIGVVIYNLARAHQKLEQNEKAIETFNEALVFFVDAQDSVSVIDCHLRIAQSYKNLGEQGAYQAYMNKVDALSKAQPLNKWQQEIKDSIAN